LEAADGEAYAAITQVYEGRSGGQTVGYTMVISTKGYSTGLELTVGVDTDGVVAGVNINSHEETAGLGANATKPEFLAQFVGVDGPYVVAKTPTGALGEVSAISGATITTQAVTDTVTLARGYFEQYLKGGA
jgi:electron transport complex protein RnfG